MMEETAPYQISEILDELLFLQQRKQAACAVHDKRANIADLQQQQYPVDSDSRNSGFSEEKNAPNRTSKERQVYNKVRRCLQRLDAILQNIMSDMPHHSPSDQQIVQEHRNGSSLELRRQCFAVLTKINLIELGVQDNTNLRQIYADICNKTMTCLVVTSTINSSSPSTSSDLAFDLQPHEAAELYNRIFGHLDLRQGQGDFFFQMSSSEELDWFGCLFALLNGGLRKSRTENRTINQYCETDDNGSESETGISVTTGGKYTNSQSTSTSSRATSTDKRTRLEKLLGGSVQVLENLILILPVAATAFERIDVALFDKHPQKDFYVQLWHFVGHLFEHIEESLAFSCSNKKNSILSLEQWMFSHAPQDQIIDEHDNAAEENGIFYDDSANRVIAVILSQLREYVSELVEFTLDVIDVETSQLGGGTSGHPCYHPPQHQSSSYENDSSCDSSKMEIETIDNSVSHSLYFAGAAYTALKFLQGCHGDNLLRNSTELSRSLWTAFAKLLLAAKTVVLSEDAKFPTTDVLVGLASLALAERDGENQLLARTPPSASENVTEASLLGRELQHALPVTFLTAIDFPDILLDHTAFLAAIAKLTTQNGDLRHLVQGVILREIIMPGAGTARNPDAMQKVLETLVTVATTTSIAVDITHDDDPWNCFFCERFAKLISLRTEL